jgi:hypothetical protein
MRSVCRVKSATLSYAPAKRLPKAGDTEDFPPISNPEGKKGHR